MRLEESGIREAVALERLYLVAAVALLYGTSQGMAVQIAGLRPQVDPHWRRGISYLTHWAAHSEKVSSTRDAHCSTRFHSYPKTHSRASPLAKLSKTTITKSGFLVSVRYRLGLDSLMIHKDVSGSQGMRCVLPGSDDGRPPLDAAGLRLHERLSAIEQSLARIEQTQNKPCPSRN